MATTPSAQTNNSISDQPQRGYAQHVDPIMVLKMAPPLLVSEMQLNHCVESTLSVVERVHSSTVFWIDALNLGRRAMSS